MLKNLVSLSEAINSLSRTLGETINLDVESVKLTQATGRIIAQDIYALEDRPSRDSTAVDGYAVRSIDTLGATQYNPVELRVIGVLRPGQTPSDICLEPGTSIRVHTGALLPCGADAVLMDEDVKSIGNKIYVYRQAPKGLNIVLRGEDFKKGDLLASKGEVVKPAVVTALAASGLMDIFVYRRIRVSIVAIGDELIEPGSRVVNGRVYNSSAYTIYSSLVKDGIFDVYYTGIIPDNVEALRKAFDREVERGVDIIITTGGTGVSESDVISRIIEQADRVVFRGVKMRPGRPTTSFVYRGKIVLSLSGYPVAAWTGYELILRNALIKWLGLKGFERKYIYAVLDKRTPNNVGYTSLIRVIVRDENGVFHAEPYMLRGSGVISSLLKTNGYIVIPEELEGYEKNDVVRVYLYD